MIFIEFTNIWDLGVIMENFLSNHITKLNKKYTIKPLGYPSGFFNGVI